MRAAAGLGLPAGALPRKNTARNSGNSCNDIPIHRGIAYSATTEPTENNPPIHRVHPSPALTQRPTAASVTGSSISTSARSGDHLIAGKLPGQHGFGCAVSEPITGRL
jgi:hypothetical protein